ncbi:MAG: hypothetical protein RLZZ312_544 [Bacteroidota bacterium]|jgi:integrase
MVYFLIKGKNNPTKIICRFKVSKIFDREITTSFLVKREDWNISKRCIKRNAVTESKDLINAKLRKLEDFLLDQWNHDQANKIPIQDNWLKLQTNSFFGKVDLLQLHKIYFVDWIKLFIENSTNRFHRGLPINPKTVQQYQVTLKKIIAFEKQFNVKLRFEDVDLKFFYNNFIFYCRNTENLGDNSITGHIKNIKLFCKNIELENLPINNDYKRTEFRGFVSITTDIYLNEVEINSIFNYDFRNNERLANARDWFIIGLWTGQRVSDFLNFTINDFAYENITIIAKKTKIQATIPVHTQIRKIIENRGGKLPHKITAPKLNVYISEVCEIVGITEVVSGALLNPLTSRKEKGFFEKWRLVSSHVCRRSFATNLYGKVPNKVIMSATGHKTEAQFLAYIKTTGTENANKIAEHWGNN